MAKKREFTINDLYGMPISVLNGTAPKEDIVNWRKYVNGISRERPKKYPELLLLILSFLLCSCVTRKACERRFPAETTDSINSITKTVIVFHDSIVYFHIAGDTLDDSINAGNGVSKLKTAYSTSYAWVEKGLLKHQLILEDTSLVKTVKNVQSSSSTSYSRLRHLDKNEKEKATSSEYLAKIDRVTNKIIAVITVIFALFICLKFWQNK